MLLSRKLWLYSTILFNCENILRRTDTAAYLSRASMTKKNVKVKEKRFIALTLSSKLINSAKIVPCMKAGF
jgi:hypothetical protein